MKALVITLLAFGTIASTAVVAGDVEATAAPYDLAVENGSVSAHVNEGSLIALVQDLGHRVGFEVIAHNVLDKSVTLDFERLPLSTAIRVICQKIGYVAVPDPVTGKTVRLVLTPSRSVAANRVASRRDPLPPLREPEDDPFAAPVEKKPAPPADDADSSSR